MPICVLVSACTCVCISDVKAWLPENTKRKRTMNVESIEVLYTNKERNNKTKDSLESVFGELNVFYMYELRNYVFVLVALVFYWICIE